MNNIRILKLQDNTDIIGFVTQLDDGSFYIITPMQIIVHTEGKYSGIILREWLPARLLELNEATINPNKIVCILKPNKFFIDYYIKFTIEIKNKLAALNNEVDIKEFSEDDTTEEFEKLTREENQILH
jgi:hypothetical protein